MLPGFRRAALAHWANPAPNLSYRHLPLVLSRKGYPYSLNRKLRRAESGETVEYWAADSLQAYVTGLYEAAGLKGSSHSVRRTVPHVLLRRAASIGQVQLLLGHEGIDDTRRYIDVAPAVLRRAFEVVI